MVEATEEAKTMGADKVTLSKEESAKLLASEASLLVKPEGLGDKIIAVHAKDGSLHAVSAVCTHRGCTVGYDETKGELHCPCHGSVYDVDGHNLEGPAERPLKPYDIGADNGAVVITF